MIAVLLLPVLAVVAAALLLGCWRRSAAAELERSRETRQRAEQANGVRP
jgi:hypothetical protein